MSSDAKASNSENVLKDGWQAWMSSQRSAGNARQEPCAVFEWKDTKTDATGWVVFDRVINQIAGGGIFMHANATAKETADIAYNMSRKFTVTAPQIGGAKAGIRFDHRDSRAKGVLQRFIEAMETLLKSTWVTAGDLNTDDRFIEKVIQDSLGLPTCQHALAQKVAEKTGSENRGNQLAKIVFAPANVHFPLIEAAVGYGLAAAIAKAVDYCTKFQQGCLFESGQPVRTAIQGFGAVGSSAAHYLMTRGIGVVVALADKDGFIVNPNGIDIDALLQRRKELLEGDLLGASDQARSECAKNFMCNYKGDALNALAPLVVRRTQPRTPRGDEDFLIQFLQATDAEAIALCATRYALTKDVVAQGLNNGAWSGGGKAFGDVKRRKVRAAIVCCGANNVFGVMREETGTLDEDRTYSVANMLVKRGACVVADWVANSGTAQLFHRGLSVDFDLRKPADALAHDVLEACAEPIRAFLDQAFAQFARMDPAYLLFGVELLAKERLANPVKMVSPASNEGGTKKSPYALPPLSPEKMPSLAERERLCRSMMLEVIDSEGHTLLDLLRNNPSPVAYDGFEPSGRMHVAQGVMKSIIVNRMTRSGFTFLIWVADWFAWLNHKMGGDLDAIKTVGQYMIEIWRSAGMDMSRVKFLWASEEFSKRHNEYWPLVLDIATKYSINRVKRCSTIMGRAESDEMKVSGLLYPCMQCADIFFLGVDVAQLGNDQRKINAVAIEFSGSKEGKARDLKRPIILSHNMIAGLKEGQEKMSKSDPETALFMEDSEEDIRRKIKAAFCPPGQVDHNPVLNYFEHIVFPREEDDNSLPLRVPTKGGGMHEYKDFASFSADFASGVLHPADIKPVLIGRMNAYLEPVRKHFAENAEAKALLERVRALTQKYKKVEKEEEEEEEEEDDE